MATVLDRFSADIGLQYSLVDRIRVKGHIRNMQSVSMLRSYFEQTQGVSWIEPRHLRGLRGAAERQAALIDRAIAPERRHDAAGRARNDDRAGQLAGHLAAVHASVLRQSLGRPSD